MRSGEKIAALLLPLLLLACGACGGGGGGGGGPTMPTPEPPRLVLTPTGGAANNSITLASGAGSTASVLVLEVRATEVSDLYGLAFDLSYPQTLLRFDGLEEGTFLSQSGAQTSLLTNTTTAGTVVVGLTRLGPVSGAGGSGLLLTLRFTAVGAGTGTLGFSRNSAADATGADRTLTWGGANVQVVL